MAKKIVETEAEKEARELELRKQIRGGVKVERAIDRRIPRR